jgi:DsbC/DsbD-like thiol-disulfide interchange protein
MHVNCKNNVNTHMTRTRAHDTKPRILWLAAWLIHSCAAYAGTAVKTGHTEAQLLSEQRQIQPGQAFWLALQLTPEPGWHTYWKNPGDAGKATTIQWQLPAGLRAGPLQWPYPDRIRTGTLVSFGYTGTVHLLTEINVGPLPPGTGHIEISAAADWLVCEEICIPESAELSLKLAVGATAAGSANAEIFESTRALLPVPAAWIAHYVYKDNQLVFDAPLPNTAELETVLFFPLEDNLIEHSSSQSFLLGENTLRVSANAGYLQQTGVFHGVLVLKHSDSSVATALEFTADPVQQLPELKFTTKPSGNGRN